MVIMSESNEVSMKDAELVIKDKAVDIGFWQLSKRSRLYGHGSGESRAGSMCRRCGAVVGDNTLHAQWHAMIEKIDVSKVVVSASY